ncbi:MAG: baseplate wedge protein 53 [Proteobacteria bacterium]|nr:baseplate wedge protein 53 [Pseudomonadota bacterium]
MYFNKFPTTEYDFNSIGVEGLEILDILTRVRFMFNDVFSNRAYNTYQLKHGDTPDIIAHNYYGHSDWWWLVLLYNDIINPFNEIPRMGFDYKSIPGDYPNPNPVIYIEKTGGDKFDDFKEGDIIIKTRSDSDLKEVYGSSVRVYHQPQPLQPSSSDFATAKIIKWRNSFREATLSDIHGDNFYTGDTIGVLRKYKNKSVRLTYWGKVLKTFENNADAINHFIENDSGRIIHPQYSIQERKVKPSGPLIKQGDTANSISGTLINAVLGGSGSSGTTYSNSFTAITTKETFDDYAKGSIKLLDKSFKNNALDLLNTLLTNRNLTYATFEIGRKAVSKSKFINLPDGNDITSSSTIY